MIDLLLKARNQVNQSKIFLIHLVDLLSIKGSRFKYVKCLI
nr:MAG TPA: hypothetical protein [Bacteriophage sp.]